MRAALAYAALMEVDWDSFYAHLDETAPPPPGVLDMEASGFGREGGPEGIDEYLSIKYVAMAM